MQQPPNVHLAQFIGRIRYDLGDSRVVDIVNNLALAAPMRFWTMTRYAPSEHAA